MESHVNNQETNKSVNSYGVQKKIKMSADRKITISKEHYELLKLDYELVIKLVDDSLLIQPMSSECVDFSEYILKDLIESGYHGMELMSKFKEIKSKLPDSIDKLSQEALMNKPLTADMSFDEFFDEDE